MGNKPVYKAVDSLVLYTLSPTGVSEFADVRLCGKDKCQGYDSLAFESALQGISNSTKIMLATILLYLSMAEFD